MNAYGTPLANQAVSVQVDPGGSATELWVAGQIYPINSQTPATLYTDARGKLTFLTMTNTGLATPNLVATADGLVKLGIPVKVNAHSERNPNGIPG